jgi:hypothetical protein
MALAGKLSACYAAFASVMAQKYRHIYKQFGGYMRKVFSLIWANSEPFSQWATVFAFVAAIFGGGLAYGQLKIANAQLEQANEQRKWQNYNEMNVRYAELYKSIPGEIASGCVPGNFETLEPETKRWVRQYFDLYSEEYWLFLNKLIPDEMWTHRIYGGVRVNLGKYPALVAGYGYWKAAGSFTHPNEFQAEVDLAISEAKRAPYTTKLGTACASRAAPSAPVDGTLRNQAE